MHPVLLLLGSAGAVLLVAAVVFGAVLGASRPGPAMVGQPAKSPSESGRFTPGRFAPADRQVADPARQPGFYAHRALSDPRAPALVAGASSSPAVPGLPTVPSWDEVPQGNGANLALAAAPTLQPPGSSPVAAAPSPLPQPSGGPGLSNSVSVGAADGSGAQAWVERPIPTEQPEVAIGNDLGEPAVLLLTSQAGTREIAIGPQGARAAVMPGSYQYELHSLQFRETGQPDQSGTLLCRRYRLYELRLYLTRPNGATRVENLGDAGR